MKNFTLSGCFTRLILTIIGVMAFVWVFSLLFPRAYNVLEGKVLGIKEDSVITVVQNKDTLSIAKPKPIVETPKEVERSINLEHSDNCYYIKTDVMGIPMKMLLDTGASNLSMSIVEYEFLRKQGLIGDSIVGEGECSIANGQTVKCYFIKIPNLKIGDTVIEDVDCTVMPQQDAPILLGMNVLRKLGNFSIDYQKNLLIVKE